MPRCVQATGALYTMSWEAFAYICRKAAAQIDAGATITDGLNRAMADKAAGLYGDAIRPDGWPRQLLDRLQQLPQRERATDALRLYGSLELQQQLQLPMGLKNNSDYLSALAVVYLVVASLYGLVVAPELAAVFASYGVMPPATFTFFIDYWFVFVIVVLLALVLMQLVTRRITRLIKFPLDVEKTLVFRHLLSNDLRRNYHDVIDLLQCPLVAAGSAQGQRSPLVDHLMQAQSSGLDLGRELQALLNVALLRLAAAGERYLKKLLVIAALLIAGTIFQFVLSIYQQIFAIGQLT